MTINNGMSVVGQQVLMSAGEFPGTLWSLSLTQAPVQFPQRVGFYYVMMYAGGGFDQRFVIEQGPIYRPGRFSKIFIPPPSASWRLEIRAFWDIAGLSWQVATA